MDALQYAADAHRRNMSQVQGGSVMDALAELAAVLERRHQQAIIAACEAQKARDAATSESLRALLTNDVRYAYGAMDTYEAVLADVRHAIRIAERRAA